MGGRIKSGHDVGGGGSANTPHTVMPGPRIKSGGDPGTHGRRHLSRPPPYTLRCRMGGRITPDLIRIPTLVMPGLDPGTHGRRHSSLPAAMRAEVPHGWPDQVRP